MKRSSTPANKGDRYGQFRSKDAQRIADVVHIVESTRRGRNPSKLPRSFGGGGGGSGVEVATFCGAWPKGQSKQITITASSATAVAINFLCSIQPIASESNYTRLCIVATGDSEDYFLVNAEC